MAGCERGTLKRHPMWSGGETAARAFRGSAGKLSAAVEGLEMNGMPFPRLEEADVNYIPLLQTPCPTPSENPHATFQTPLGMMTKAFRNHPRGRKMPSTGWMCCPSLMEAAVQDRALAGHALMTCAFRGLLSQRTWPYLLQKLH